jgi:dynein heavy chain
VGLDKLITTGQDVAVMQEELVALQPVLEQTQKEVSEMMVVIKADTEAANETKAVVAKDEEAASAKAAECKKIQDDAQADLDEALPALDKALESLKSLSKGDIVEVKSLQKPPGGVRTVIDAVCIMFEQKPKKVAAEDGRGKVDDYWDVGKAMLGNAEKFLKSLFDYDKENIPEKVIKKIGPYIENPDFTPEAIKKVSVACTAVCMWVHAMVKFHHVSRSIEPKRQMLAGAQAELKVTMDGLEVTKAKLAEVVAKLDELDKNYQEALAKQQELAAKVEECEGKLSRAHQLLGGLGGEKDRWAITVEKLKGDYEKLQGDVTVAAGTIAYLGAFTSTYREKITDMWRSKLKELGVPSNEGVDLLQVLMDPVQVREWGIQGLPSDNVSIANAIIVTKARRWPLMIDPQLQGNQWVRNMEKEHGLDQIKLTDKDYLRTLENAIRFGRAVLLENIQESLDAALEPVLGKQTFKQRGTVMIKLGDSVIPYHPEFKFYMTTKLANPHYPPEVSVKVSLLNFMITSEGLEEQLLNLVVAQERPDLAAKKGELVISMAKMKKDMQDIEDEILHLLANSQGDILDDEVLINTLAASKVTSEEIKVKVQDAEATSSEIKEVSDQYIPVAFRGSILFFCISGLNVVDPMYEYSMAWYRNLFINGIENAEPDEDIPARCIKLNDYITYSLYCNVCCSLFEKDKLLFSFLVTVRILQGFNEIDGAEWNFLLKGGTITEFELENPAPSWLTEAAWLELSNLATLKAFEGLDKDVIAMLDDIKAVFDSATPHEDALPGQWAEKLNSFQKLLFLRCLRPDKVVDASMAFITEKFGQRFVEPPPFDLAGCFESATNMTPLIFVLSTGADPMADLVRFATEMKMNKKLTAISLGQGQGPIAASMISEGMERGTWVLLQNCHLAKSWMPEFDKIVEEFSPDKMHRDFRLWLTSMPSPIFPVAVLQNGVKMTLEPPKGLKANVRRTYLGFKPEKLLESNNPPAWRKLLFSISFFHALVQERRKFGALGWNIRYAFGDTDLECCVQQIHDFIDVYDEIPYTVMTLLCGDVNYGGRVTDDKDRRCMNSILDLYITEQVMDDDYKFSESGLFFCPPDDESRDHYIDYCASLPINPSPEVQGLHDNADITCAQNEMLAMFATIVSLGGGGGSSAAGKTPDEIVYELCESYLKSIPKPLNLEDVMVKYPTDYNECMNTVSCRTAGVRPVLNLGPDCLSARRSWRRR